MEVEDLLKEGNLDLDASGAFGEREREAGAE